MHRGGVDAKLDFTTRLVDGFSSLGMTTIQTIGPMLAILILLFPRECWRVIKDRAQTDCVRLAAAGF